MKFTFHLLANKTSIHMKSFALSLALLKRYSKQLKNGLSITFIVLHFSKNVSTPVNINLGTFVTFQAVRVAQVDMEENAKRKELLLGQLLTQTFARTMALAAEAQMAQKDLMGFQEQVRSFDKVNAYLVLQDVVKITIFGHNKKYDTQTTDLLE